MSRIQTGDEQKREPEPPAQAGLPEWLASLGASETLSAQEPMAPEENPAVEQAAADQAETDQAGTEPAAAEPAAAGQAEESGGNEPDWLKRIRARQRVEYPQEEELTGGEENLPGILASSPADETPLSPEQLPDWLSNLGKQETAASEAASPEPDWSFLEGMRQPPAAEEEESPEWLAQLDEEKNKAVPSEGTVIHEPGSEAMSPASSNLPLPEEELPDWLARLEASGAGKAQGPIVPAFIEEESPEPPFNELEQAGPKVETPDLNALPEWISQLPVQEAGAEETNGEVFSQAEAKPAESEDLMPAELPSWLEAMRPVEAVTSLVTAEEAKGKVEKAGPLAGLRGALSAEAGAGAQQKPKAFSVKLQVTESQQAHMALMEELLKTETAGRPVGQRAAVNASYLMRILVALILLLAVLAPLWINKNMTPMPSPALASQEILDASTVINGVVPGAPVLLAFDYEPGLSGEMDVAAQAVIEHLMGRGAYLTIVSTNVSGPLLAERMLDSIAVEKGTAYALAANLGYVPGGASALLNLAENPRQVLPYDLRSVKVWDSGPLARVKSAADFSLAVVFTEKAETARGWVEQVQPTLQKNNVPLVMVVSAQAEPMVRPYYETSPRQVAGMISGLASFAAYDSLRGQTGLARTYWDAYGAGMLAAAGLLLLGGLSYGGIALFTPRKRAESEGAT